MGDSAAAAHLESLILRMLSGGADVAAAEAELRARAQSRGAGRPLLLLATSSAHEAARQMGALLVRRSICSLWSRARDGAARAALGASLLGALAREPSRGVRKALVSVVAALGKVALDGGAAGWPELGALLQHASADARDDVRELSLLLVHELADALSAGSLKRLIVPMLRAPILAGLHDASAVVRVAALRATGALFLTLESPAAHRALAPTLPPLVSALRAALGDGARGGEDVAAVVLEALCELVGRRSPLLADAVAAGAIAELMIATVAARALENNTRGAAAEVLSALLRAQPALWVSRADLLRDLLGAIVGVASERDAAAADGRMLEAAAAGLARADVADDAPDALVQNLLDVAANQLPTSVLGPPLFATLVAAAGAPAPALRRAAFALLGSAAEGLSDAIQTALPSVLGLVAQGAADADATVREGAAYALAMIAEAAQPAIRRMGPALLAPVLILLNDASPGVALRACWALENAADALPGEAVAPVADAAIGSLSTLMARPLDSPLGIT
jgi:hypothetical protein